MNPLWLDDQLDLSAVLAEIQHFVDAMVRDDGPENATMALVKMFEQGITEMEAAIKGRDRVALARHAIFVVLAHRMLQKTVPLMWPHPGGAVQ